MERDAIKAPKYHELTPQQAAAHKIAYETAVYRLCFAAFLGSYGDDREAISPKVYQDPEPEGEGR
jgi:hypothetical protein